MTNSETIVVRNSVFGYIFLTVVNVVGLLVAGPVVIFTAWMFFSALVNGAAPEWSVICPMFLFAALALWAGISLRRNVRRVRDRAPVLSLTPAALIIHKHERNFTVEVDEVIPWTAIISGTLSGNEARADIDLRYKLPSGLPHGRAGIDVYALTLSPARIRDLIEQRVRASQ